MLNIYVDADACPVKAEIYKVAGRTGSKVWLVSNAPLRLPTDCHAELVVVGSEFGSSKFCVDDRGVYSLPAFASGMGQDTTA